MLKSSRVKQMLKHAMSAYSKNTIDTISRYKDIVIMRIDHGRLQMNITDGFRICRVTEKENSIDSSEIFSVNIEEMHKIIQMHSGGYITITPHPDCVSFNYDDGVEYKLSRHSVAQQDYLANLEPFKDTRWAEITLRDIRPLLEKWNTDDYCILRIRDNIILDIVKIIVENDFSEPVFKSAFDLVKRKHSLIRKDEVLISMPCDYSENFEVEVDAIYLKKALQQFGSTGFIGINKNRVCIADKKINPTYLHMIVPIRRS